MCGEKEDICSSSKPVLSGKCHHKSLLPQCLYMIMLAFDGGGVTVDLAD